MTAGPETEGDLRGPVLERLGPHPFVEHLGCELLAAGPGTATVRLPWRSEHGRSGVPAGAQSSLHGGAAAALADLTASYALLTVLAEGEGRATIDLSVHFLAPLRGDVEAQATVRRRGRRTAVIDVELADGSGEVGALARATYAIQPAGG